MQRRKPILGVPHRRIVYVLSDVWFDVQLIQCICLCLAFEPENDKALHYGLGFFNLSRHVV